MFSNVFLVFLSAHLIGDFYFQSKAISKKKDSKISAVLLHSLIYVLPCSVFFLFEINADIFLYTFYFMLIHFIIEGIKLYINNKYDKKFRSQSNIIFIFEQLFYIVSIIIISAFYLKYNSDISMLSSITIIIDKTNYSINEIIRVFVLVIFIIKPVNIIFREIFNDIKPKQKEKKNKENNNGAIIGSMERLLMLLLLLANQYTAIGLVLTGKSIARYKLLTENKDFAEYYLVGTFYSILATLIPFFIIWKLG